jgi:hypothetical protein
MDLSTGKKMARKMQPGDDDKVINSLAYTTPLLDIPYLLALLLLSPTQYSRGISSRTTGPFLVYSLVTLFLFVSE